MAVKNTTKKKSKIISRVQAVLVPADRGAGWEIAAKSFVAVALFLLPIFVAPWSDDPWELQKLLLLFTAVGGGWICLMVAMIRRHTDRWSWHPLDLLVVLFGLLATVSTFTSVHWWTSLFGAASWNSHSLFATWIFIGLYFLIAKVFHGHADRRFAWVTILIGLGVSLLIQLFQFADISLLVSPLNESRWFGTIANFNLHITIIAALFSVAMLMLWNVVEERWAKLLLAVGAVIGWLVLFFSGRPLGWAILVIGMVVVVWYHSRDEKHVDLRMIVAAVAIAALGIIAQLTNLASSSGLSRMTELTLDHKTTYSVAWEVLKERTVLGVGPSAWYQAFVKYRPDSYNQQAYWDLRFVQGSAAWPQMLATVGIGGALVFLGLIVLGAWMCWQGWRKLNDPLLILTGMIAIAALISGFVTTWSLVLLALLWTSLGLSRAALAEWDRGKVKKLPGWSYAVMAVATLGVVIVSVPFCGWYISDALVHKAVNQANNNGSANQVIKTLRQALTMNQRNETASQYLATVYAQEVLTKAAEKDYTTASKDLSLSLSAISQAISRDKNNPALYETENQLLNELATAIPNAMTEALDNYATLRNIEPANPIHDVAYGQIVMLQATSSTNVTDATLKAALKKALAAFDEALQKKPGYFQAMLAKAQALLDGKEYDSSLAVFANAVGLSDAQRSLVLQINAGDYAGLKKDAEAKQAYADAITADPSSATAYLLAADYYKDKGDKTKAKEILNQGKAKLPSDTRFQTQLDELK